MSLYFLIIASYQTLLICEFMSSPYLQYHFCYKELLKCDLQTAMYNYKGRIFV